MARKRKNQGGPGSGDWLNTYADMVTLLLTFFILLFSMSSLDAAKFNMLVNAFASDRDSSDRIIIYGEGEGDTQLAHDRGPDDVKEIKDLSDIYEQLKEYIEQQQLQDKVDISKGDNYIFIQFMDDMLFEPNSAQLRPVHMELLSFVGYGVKSIQDSVEMISINGHTAAIPEDPDYTVSDRLLSSSRANAVLMHFEDNIGIDPGKLVQLGWGKQKPFADNNTEEGRAKNRRVEILISMDNPIADQLDNVYEKLLD